MLNQEDPIVAAKMRRLEATILKPRANTGQEQEERNAAQGSGERTAIESPETSLMNESIKLTINILLL